MKCVLLIVLSLILSINGYIMPFGPTIKATKGEVWPKPQQQEKSDDYLVVRKFRFHFNVTNNNCAVLEEAISRYRTIISKCGPLKQAEDQSINKQTANLWPLKPHCKGFLNTLNVALNNPCKDDEYPAFGTSENYTLKVSEKNSELSSDTVWGIIRGLETFSQLIVESDNYLDFIINLTTITDYPRYPYRGLMLDTSRHYMPMHSILETLDAMAYNKFNAFHWHMVDDQSFPFVSRKFPQLSEKGAYQPITLVYQPKDVQLVIEYARVRGIRVIPEFDSPGHTRSWGEGMPGLLTPCYNQGQFTGQYGPIDPSKESNFDFIQKLFAEIAGVFPDPYIHIGGDEVDYRCWQNDSDVNAFMDKLNITGDYAALETYYVQRVLNYTNNLNKLPVVWQEVFTTGGALPLDAVVQVWIADGFQDLLSQVTAAGKKAILSSCYYLDNVESTLDWVKFYTCEPSNFTGTDDQKKLLLGGEAAMWTEAVNENNVITRVWPRACAIGEKLWSAEDNRNDLTQFFEVATRLEEHACRLMHRGIHAKPPNLGGVCL